MNAPLSPPSASPLSSGRRIFLKTGIAGATLLLAGRWLPAGATERLATAAYARLLSADAALLRRVIPVVLAGALPAGGAQRAAAIDEVVAGVDTIIDHQPPAVRQELRDLFGLLTKTVTRALVAGIWVSWDKATDEDIGDFLASWRGSRFALLRSGYVGLHNLIVGSWYGNPRAWVRIGYRGPPGIS